MTKMEAIIRSTHLAERLNDTLKHTDATIVALALRSLSLAYDTCARPAIRMQIEELWGKMQLSLLTSLAKYGAHVDDN